MFTKPATLYDKLSVEVFTSPLLWHPFICILLYEIVWLISSIRPAPLTFVEIFASFEQFVIFRFHINVGFEVPKTPTTCDIKPPALFVASIVTLFMQFSKVTFFPAFVAIDAHSPPVILPWISIFFIIAFDNAPNSDASSLFINKFCILWFFPSKYPAKYLPSDTEPIGLKPLPVVSSVSNPSSDSFSFIFPYAVDSEALYDSGLLKSMSLSSSIFA